MWLSELLQPLLFEGRLAFTDSLRALNVDEDDSLAILRSAFRAHQLGIADPPLAFERHVALATARLVIHVAWHALNNEQIGPKAEESLRLPTPKTPSEHLSADLCLRFAPQIYQRAVRIHPNDILTQSLEETLRAWPLSGVLSSLTDGPTGPLDFGGHEGLMLLYAERLADHFKPAWVPQGPARAYVEWVWTALGKDVALLGAETKGNTNCH
jgi:MoxR-vWA-beta-propeller ternary system protein